MQQTEHYGLNQWDLSDRVLMSDFNADNAKIAAALAGKLGPIEILVDRSSTKPQNSVYIGGKIGPWENWALTMTFFVPVLTEQQKKDNKFEINLGNGYGIDTIEPGPFAVIFLPLHDGTREASGILLSEKKSGPFLCGCTFDSFEFAGAVVRTGDNHMGQMSGYSVQYFGVR